MRAAIGMGFLLILPALPFPGLKAEESRPRAGVPTFLPAHPFVHRPGRPYVNRAKTDYEIPDQTLLPPFDRRNYYGPLGHHLIYGYDVFSWRETRADFPIGQAPNSQVRKQNARYGLLDRNIVGFDSYSDWSARLIIGDEIRTFFTPLTLDMTGVNGVRLDVDKGPSQFSLLASRFRDPIWVAGTPQSEARNASLLTGGRGELHLGALTLGATGVHFNLFDSEQGDFSLRGDLRGDQVLPSFIIARFADDSPGDERAGAAISEVCLLINGEYRPDIAAELVRIDARNPTAVGLNNRLTGQFQRRPYTDQGTRYADFFYLRRHLQGEDVSRNVNLGELVNFIVPIASDAELRADGHDVILAFFDLTEEYFVEQVEVEAVVGNDYRVELVGLYEAEPQATQEQARWRLANLESLHRAPGNVQDLSNATQIRLDAGAWTGRTVVGVDGHFERGRTRIRGEFARSIEYLRYPDGRPGHRPPREFEGVRQWNGARSTTRDASYYLTAEWASSYLELGGELFSVGPDFTRQLIGDHVAAVPGAEISDGFVEDNDDNDRWPDRGPGARGGHQGATNYDPDGVFPGNDEDNDGIPDTNRNGNALPDYVEPFLLFAVEPDQYFYGRDWNHNGIADVREDDLEPDLPYQQDQRGGHVFGRLRLPGGWFVGVGRLKAKGISSERRNEIDYASIALSRRDWQQGYFAGEMFLRRVHDDFANPYQTFEETLSEPAPDAPYHSPGSLVYDRTTVGDLLEWRDSIDRQHYLEGAWWPLAGLRLDGNMRYAINRQQAAVLSDGSDQGADEIRLLTLVARAAYHWEATANWLVVFQGKGLYLRRNRDSLPVALEDEWTLVPILKAQYRLTPRTEFSCGMQGLPFLPLSKKDRTDNRNSFTEAVRVVQLTNHSNYFGYVLSTNVGLRLTRRTFDDPTRAGDDLDVTSLFMRVFLGFE